MVFSRDRESFMKDNITCINNTLLVIDRCAVLTYDGMCLRCRYCYWRNSRHKRGMLKPEILSYRFGGIRVSFPVSGALQKASEDAAPSLHGDAPLSTLPRPTSVVRLGPVRSVRIRNPMRPIDFSATHAPGFRHDVRDRFGQSRRSGVTPEKRFDFFSFLGQLR